MSERWPIAIVAAVIIHGAVGALIYLFDTPVKPFLECVEPHADGSYTAHFGYINNGDEPWTVSSDIDGGREVIASPPATFQPGRTAIEWRYQQTPEGILAYPVTPVQVRFAAGQEVEWQVNFKRAAASDASEVCTPPKQQKEVTPVLPKKKEPPKVEKKEEPKPKPPPKEEKKVEEKKPEQKKPEAKAEKKTRKPKNQIKKKGQPKKRKKPTKKVETKKAEPAPLVLSNVSLTGGIGVQQGEQDIFGDPTVAATEENTNVEVVDEVDPSVKEIGTGEPAKEAPKKVEFVAAKPVSGHRGWGWPAGAPNLSRDVTVSLSVLVGTDGSVKKVKVIKGAGGVFDAEAKRRALRMKFKPATRDGVPYQTWIPWPVRFTQES